MVYVKNAEVPDGFESVVMPNPLAYIPNDAIQNHYLMLCCDDLEWMLGKIIKMNKPTARLQLNVEWKQGDTAGQQAKLSNYFVVGGDASDAGAAVQIAQITCESQRESPGIARLARIKRANHP